MSAIEEPLVSVVMPCRDQVDFVAEAVASVLDEPGVPVELLVMDPGSTDGSRELLTELAPRYGARLRLCFENDTGQSDAVNRGVAGSRGRILGWLNSDDRLRPGALTTVAAVLDEDPTAAADDPAWLYGQAAMIDADGRAVTTFIARYKRWRGRRFSRLKLLTENFIPQMAVFWNRAMWDRAGGLDTHKDLDMDYDLWLRFAAVAEPSVLRDVLADFRVHAHAKGSVRTGEQLQAAWRTCRAHAAGLGVGGAFAVAAHRVLSWRTRILYRFLKPKPRVARTPSTGTSARGAPGVPSSSR